MPTRILAITLILAALAGCSHPRHESTLQSAIEPQMAPTRVEVRRDGDAFRARFEFPETARVWAFHRSALRRKDQQPWRFDSWSVLTSAVELVRIGRYDALVSTGDGVLPEVVEIRFTPAAVDLIADYDPALVFSDGIVALFSGAFSAFPAASREALVDYDDSAQTSATKVTMINPGGSVFHAGRYVAQAEFAEDGYGIYGNVTLASDAAVASILDPQLPAWIARSLATTIPEVFRFYEAELGEHGGAKPLIIASYSEPDRTGVSQGGSVLSGVITMRMAGAGLRIPNEAVRANMTWFIAHEAAHFWIGQALAYDNRDRAWITEGGADMMAMVAAAAINSEFSSDQFLERAKADCAAAVSVGGIEAARLRNEQRPYYACGMLFAHAVDRAGRARGEDYFDFLRGLIASQEDGRVSGEEWLGAAARFGVSADRIALMRRLLAEPTTDPEGDLGRLLGG